MPSISTVSMPVKHHGNPAILLAEITLGSIFAEEGPQGYHPRSMAGHFTIRKPLLVKQQRFLKAVGHRQHKLPLRTLCRHFDRPVSNGLL